MLVFSLLYLLTKKAFNFTLKNIPSLSTFDIQVSKAGVQTPLYEGKGIIKMQEIDSYLFTRIVALVLIYSGLININFYYIQSIGMGIGLFSGLFYINQTSVVIETLIYIIGAFIVLSIRPNKTNLFNSNSTFHPGSQTLNNSPSPTYEAWVGEDEEKIDYSLIVLFSVLGSSFLISSSDLISLYLSIELQSFGLYVLSTLYKNNESSTRAGLKYFLLGGLSSCIILLGMGLIYSYSGLTNLELIYSLNNGLTNLSGYNTNSFASELTGLNVGFSLIFIGFLFKIAAAPLHNWSPDVYDDTPTIVTTWLTIIPKLSIVILLLELYFQFALQSKYSISTLPASIYSSIPSLGLVGGAGAGNNLKTILLVSSLLSLIIGTVVGLSQTKIKRLLAYSTISHIGFILLTLGIKSSQSIDSLLFYIIQYTITNLNIFLILITLSYFRTGINNKDIKFISEFKGLLYENPYLSFSLMVSIFSLAGVPPLLGFFAKQFSLYAAINEGYYFLAVVAIITSVISASYYLKIIRLNLDASTDNNTSLQSKNTSPIYSATPSNMSQQDALTVGIISTPPIGGADDAKSMGEDKNKNYSLQIQETIKYYLNNLPLKGSHNKTTHFPFTDVQEGGVLSPVSCTLISFFTLFILLFILKPSIILSSTGVLSLYLWGFFI